MRKVLSLIIYVCINHNLYDNGDEFLQNKESEQYLPDEMLHYIGDFLPNIKNFRLANKFLNNNYKIITACFNKKNFEKID